MTQILTKEKFRLKRRQLYQEPVFLVCHEALRPLLCSLDIVELFVFSEEFTQDILLYQPADHLMMEDEVGYVWNDKFVEGEYRGTPEEADIDYHLLLILSLVKLHALRHINPHARPLSKLLLAFCREYEGLRALLGEFILKEHQLRDQGKITFKKRSRQSKVEPPTVENETEPPHPAAGDGKSESYPEVRKFLAAYADNCKKLTSDTMERALIPLLLTNAQYHFVFTGEINHLVEELGLKNLKIVNPQVNGDLVMNKKVENEVNGVAKGGTGIIIGRENCSDTIIRKMGDGKMGDGNMADST